MTRLETVDPSDDRQYAEFYAAYAAAYQGTLIPLWTAREKRVHLQPDPYEPYTALFARDDDGRPVGGGSVTLPQRDNLDFAYAEVWTVPDRRREGHATAVLDALEDIARRAGRSTVFMEATSPLDDDHAAPVAFLEKRGYTFDMRDAVRELPLPAEPPAPSADPAYRLESWHGRVPDDRLEQYAALRRLIVSEAPQGDAGLEDQYWDAERVRSEQDRRERQGRDFWITVAVAPDGTLAGHTDLVLPEGSVEAFQWDTLVLREHRGHGLGLAMKLANMHAAADDLAGRRAIVTYNAAANAHMIAVNEAMGYRQVAWVGEYVKKI
jgi:GNAT superfamily N-acetyltransferase